MKTRLALIAFVAIVNLAFAQEKTAAVEKSFDETAAVTSMTEESRRKGYIGLSLGPSIPLGAFVKKENFAAGTGLTGPEETSVGLHLSLVNFGYLISDNAGIAASWFGAAYARSSNRSYELEPWACGSIMVGPLYSYPMAQKAELDVRALIGRSVCRGQAENGGTTSVETNKAFIFNAGTIYRLHLSKYTSLLLSAEYYSTNLKFRDGGANWPGADEQPIKALSLGVGVAYRIR